MLRHFISMALALSVTACAAQAQGDEKQIVSNAVQQLVPQAKLDAVEPSTLPGFYEVVTSGQVLYVSKDGKYLLQGSLFDIANERDLTEVRMAGLRKAALGEVPESNSIVFAPSNPKYTVTVFTDIDCGFCRKLHDQIEQLNQQDIAVRYLWWPRSGVDTPSYDKAVSVWCSADRKKTFTEAKSGQDPQPARCDNPVAEHFALGQRLGVDGTPAVIAPDGTNLGGYMTPDVMRAKLDSLALVETNRR